jgi:hypothetical protein
MCVGAWSVACTAQSTPSSTTSAGRFPDVIEATYELGEDGTYRFDATISSPYDSEEQFADAWRLRDRSGRVFGVRELTHPHANEQPFTRSLGNVTIPSDVTLVIVEGRDSLNGWGGQTVEVNLP